VYLRFVPYPTVFVIHGSMECMHVGMYVCMYSMYSILCVRERERERERVWSMYKIASTSYLMCCYQMRYDACK